MAQSFNFDKVIQRRGTDCLKYDIAKKRGKPEDVLPLWVADMDFQTAPVVQKALQEAVEHGIFGYFEPGKAYYDALKYWFDTRFGYKFDESWVSHVPGVVFAISAAICSFTKPGQPILIMEPVYHLFRSTILQNDREVVSCNLIEENGYYSIDFADMEAKIVAHDIKLMLFCSPHNPVGRVWSESELKQVVAICKKHDVLIFSDEIHCDFVFSGHKHHVLPALCPDYAQQMILATAPSKSFNTAGLHISNIFIQNDDLRRAYRKTLAQIGISQPSLMGIRAGQAAYAEGMPWLLALTDYLQGNIQFVTAFLDEYLPQIKFHPPEGTYLAWLDFRATGLSADEIEQKLLKEAKVWLSRGDSFGETAAGFMRLNMACPKSTLEDALKRIRGVFAK